MGVNRAPKLKAPLSPPQDFGVLLRRLRKAKNLGLVELANASGIDPGLLSRIESGKRYPPDLPGLTNLANALDIPQESDEFAHLLEAADRARNPALHDMAAKMRGGKPWNPFSADLMNEEPPVFCRTLGELVSRATERAISTGAVTIMVKSESGAVQKFQLQHPAPKRKDKKKT
jgi:transcriptional regulator with XRE-family HTH domain